MNVIEIIIAVFIVVVIVTTFISEPKLSLQYFKAAGESTGKIITKIKDVIQDWREDRKNVEVTENG